MYQIPGGVLRSPITIPCRCPLCPAVSGAKIERARSHTESCETGSEPVPDVAPFRTDWGSTEPASSDRPDSSRSAGRGLLLATLTNSASASIGRGRPAAYLINPLEDVRWNDLLADRAQSSVFHTIAWLTALQKTYRYQPLALTTTAPGQKLENALALCRVESWLTGRRLVGVPFSDHCEPLVTCPQELESLLAGAARVALEQGFQYVEVRARRTDRSAASPPSPSVVRYWLHEIDLSPRLDAIFERFHKSSTQRKILRSEREGFEFAEGRSPSLLEDFYRLQTLTRRRHGLPPQPFIWFQNLAECFGDALRIRMAFKDRAPAGAIFTITHRDTLVFKYGCSDPRFHKSGVMHALFWRAIREAKRTGLHAFDLGRSDLDQQGLATFKERWGSQKSLVEYVRYEVAPSRKPAVPMGKSAQWICAHLPGPLLRAVGQFGYRHIG